MTLDERIMQLERTVAQHANWLSRLTSVAEDLASIASANEERLSRIETRLTNIETDLAIVKGWLAPPSENGSEA